MLMSYIMGIADYFVAHPSLLVALFLLYIIIFALCLMLAPVKPGPNPFRHDVRRQLEPIVVDQSARDKVLKQGFQTRLIPENLDAIIIGSGIGGLAVAAILSKVGKKVLVLEQHDQAGGSCHTFTEKGYEFDVGIHYVSKMSNNPLNKFILDQISDGQIQWDDLDDDFDIVAINNDGSKNIKYYPIHGNGYEAYKSHLLEKFPNEEKALDEYINLLKKAKKSVYYLALFKVLPKWLMKFLSKTKLIYAIRPYFSLADQTVDEVVAGLTDNVQLKTVLSYNFADYGVEPSRSSFIIHSLLANHYMKGASYPRGGASEVAFQMVPVIEKMGGRVLVRAMVSEILVEGEKVVGVRVERTGGPVDIRAPLVVSDAGAYNTFTKLLPKPIAEKTDMYRMVRNKVNTGVNLLSLFVGLKGDSKDLDLKKNNTWLFTSDDISTAIDGYLKKSLDEALDCDVPLLFISSPSAKDSTYETRHPGKSALTVIGPARWEWFEEWQNERVKKRGEEYEANKQLLIRRMWDQILTVYPQLEDKIEYMELGTGLTNEFYLGSAKGGCYGLDHSKERFSDPDIMINLRPETGIPGLLLSGQDVFCCGFMGAMFGAILTASAVLNRNVYDDVRNLYKNTKSDEKQKSK